MRGRRAKNATIGFLSARMRARKNSVVSYLDSLTEEKRQSAIDFAVGMARKRRRDNRIRQKDIQEEMSSRAKQKRDDKDRKSIESKLKEVNIDIKSEFPDLAIEKISDLVDILTGKVAGRCVLHTWYDADTRESTIWNGKIEKLKRKKGNMYTVAYWADGESYDDDAEDSSVSKFELGADLVSGDLFFC